MDERSKEWQERFEKIWDPEGQGQYRLGSPGERLVKRFLADMDVDASINEYGSGTGRAVCAMIKTPGHCRHQINMVDIALNAMEDRCRRWLDKPTLKLTFTHASLWDLPPDFPKADWGYCVDVLCFLPPEKLDAVLAEIKRTCTHFFCQVYDWDDVRLGINLTTIKKDGPWWAAKLREYWDDVTQEVSPESAHRYIFVCKGKAVAGISDTIGKLKGKYAGQTAWIIGRGTSLLQATAADFGPGPVICLNESIMNISPLGLPNDLFNIWRNGDLPADLLDHLPPGTTLLLCDNPVLKDPPSSTMFKDHSPRYTFECARDILCRPPAAFSMKAAFEIVYQIFGCGEVAFVSFDSCTTGDARTVLKNTFVNSEYRPGDYDEQCQIMFSRIKETGMNTRWITPGGAALIPWTSNNKDGKATMLNVGCGEIIEPGYINIDMTHPAADANMDALNLEYPNESVDEVRSSHLLEHFAKREVPLALREWFRILKNGGKLWLNVPNLEWCMNNWIEKPEKEKNGLAMDMIFGLQHHAGEYHKTGFTRASLAQYLENAGFEDIQIEDRWSHNQQCFIATAVKGKKKINERVTVITPTGDRPLAFALCQRWMRNQTRQPDQWIVVDDGKTPLIPGPMMQYVRREPRSDDPKHTLITNLGAAVPLIQGSKVLIMEDDEYYGPRYIEEMASRLEKHEVVGICRSKYYHLPTGGFLRHSNIDHASLAQTGFRSTFVPTLAGLFTGDTYLDIRIWKKAGNVTTLKWGEPTVVVNSHSVGNGRGLLFDDGDGDDKGCLYVGMKGLPGRPGIGCGHRDYSEYLPDTPDRKVLRRWIPADYKIYSGILDGTINEQTLRDQE